MQIAIWIRRGSWKTQVENSSISMVLKGLLMQDSPDCLSIVPCSWRIAWHQWYETLAPKFNAVSYWIYITRPPLETLLMNSLLMGILSSWTNLTKSLLPNMWPEVWPSVKSVRASRESANRSKWFDQQIDSDQKNGKQAKAEDDPTHFADDLALRSLCNKHA